MRVCIVTVASYVRLGGMQDHTCDLSACLVRLGHEVDVITGRRPDGVQEVERDGVRWHHVGVPAKITKTPFRHPRWFAASAAAFERLHERQPFDVVHSESTSALGLVRRGVHRRVPVVAKFHGNYLGLARAAVRRAARARSRRATLREARTLAWLTSAYLTPPTNVYGFRDCEAIVASRQQLEDTVCSHRLQRDRVHVVPNGIDTRVFSPRPRNEARAAMGLGDGPVIASVGRLHREKGLNFAIEAISRLDGPRRPRLVLVGDGPDREALERQARELGVEGQVVFAGRQDHEGVAAYLGAADVVVFPTVREEAAPLVVPQAMAVGVPVVASAIGGITEVVSRPGENGILVPPADVDALTRQIADLLADPGLAARIGEQGRQRVLEEYTVETMAERTLAVYEIAAARLRAASAP